jgi:hypothetical protein
MLLRASFFLKPNQCMILSRRVAAECVFATSTPTRGIAEEPPKVTNLLFDRIVAISANFAATIRHLGST